MPILDQEAQIVSQVLAAWPYLDTQTRRTLADFTDLRFPAYHHLINTLWEQKVNLQKGHELETILEIMGQHGYADEAVHDIIRYYSAANPQTLAEIAKYPHPYGIFYVQRKAVQAVRAYLTQVYQACKDDLLKKVVEKYPTPDSVIPELNRLVKVFTIEYDSSPRTYAEMKEAAKDVNAVSLQYVIPTGFPTLDKTLGGGLQPKRMTLIQAGTGVGKTSLTLQIIHSAIQHEFRVLYLSYEMDNQDIIQRLLSQTLQVPVSVIKERIETQNCPPEQDEAGERIDKFMRIEFPGNTGAISQVETAILDYLRIYGEVPNLVVVDFIQLLSMGELRSPGSNRVEDLENVSRMLYSYGKEYNTHILCLSQMTDDHSYGGRAIEHPCDAVLWLRESEENHNKRDLEVKKNRFGPKNVIISMIWYGHTTSFTESGQTSGLPKDTAEPGLGQMVANDPAFSSQTHGFTSDGMGLGDMDAIPF